MPLDRPSPAKPNPPAEQPVDRPSPAEAHLEFMGIFKVSVSETNSWMTMMKMLSLVLGSWLGIRLINTLFLKLGVEKSQT